MTETMKSAVRDLLEVDEQYLTAKEVWKQAKKDLTEVKLLKYQIEMTEDGLQLVIPLDARLKKIEAECTFVPDKKVYGTKDERADAIKAHLLQHDNEYLSITRALERQKVAEINAMKDLDQFDKDLAHLGKKYSAMEKLVDVELEFAKHDREVMARVRVDKEHETVMQQGRNIAAQTELAQFRLEQAKIEHDTAIQAHAMEMKDVVT